MTSARLLEEFIRGMQAEMDRRFDLVEKVATERDLRYAQRFELSRRTVEEALAAGQLAVDKSERATEKRFEAVNEFRAQLADQASTFIPREVAEASLAELRRAIETNSTLIYASQGERKGSYDSRTALTSLIVVLVGLAAVISPHIH